MGELVTEHPIKLRCVWPLAVRSEPCDRTAVPHGSLLATSPGAPTARYPSPLGTTRPPRGPEHSAGCSTARGLRLASPARADPTDLPAPDPTDPPTAGRGGPTDRPCWEALRDVYQTINFEPPSHSTVITYKYQELTLGGKPRFPVFMRIRPHPKA